MDHPAKFPDRIVTAIGRILADETDGPLKILDPFAGVGLIHDLADIAPGRWTTTGVEIEPEWAAEHPRTEVGDALRLRFRAGSFDVVATSPCYGNRMADHHNARDFCKVCDGSGEHPEIFSEPDDPIDCEACAGWGLSKRNTYRAYLGRQLSEGSSAAMQWGPAYREFHAAAWAEAVRVLKPGGLLIVNISNHYRKHTEQHVAEFHLNAVCLLGCTVLRVDPIRTQRNRQGANGDSRTDRELIIVARTPDPRRPN